MSRVARDIPLAEISLRRYEKPNNMQKRDLVKKLCLSVGLLNPGDSRDVVVDVFYVLLAAKKEGQELGSEEIKTNVLSVREENGLPMKGVASSNIRRQVKRLRDIHFVEKRKNKYRINENSALKDIFEGKVKNYMILPIMERIREYLEQVDNHF